MTDTRNTGRRARTPSIALIALLALVLAAPEARAFGIREQNEQNDEPAVEDAGSTDGSQPVAGANDEGSEPPDDSQRNSSDEAPEPREPDGEPDGEPEAETDEAEAEADQTAAVEDDDERPEAIVVEDIFSEIHRAPIELPEPLTVRDLAIQVEADRRLLAELRKEIPSNRAEAELYLRRIRELAAISDPVALVPVANNVIRQAPALFEWLETEYDDPDERARDYYIGGSWAFHRRFEAFRKAVLLTVIRRLDAIGYILQGDQE